MATDAKIIFYSSFVDPFVNLSLSSFHVYSSSLTNLKHEFGYILKLVLGRLSKHAEEVKRVWSSARNKFFVTDFDECFEWQYLSHKSSRGFGDSKNAV